jgi:uncharacterized protein YjbJ (UPF0337 family)
MGKKAKRLARKVAALNAEVAGLKTQMAHMRTERKAAKAEIGGRHKKLAVELGKAKHSPKREEKGAEVPRKKAVVEARIADIKKSPKPVAVVEETSGSKPLSAIEMNKQEVKGRQEQADGKLRGEAGKKAGNLEDQIMGKAQEVKGTLREAVGRTARRIDEK